ncbi:hypothetical protein HYT17_01565 [Candidatus Microgenomates bacterium]|nr:hypothetical protein [Candidatus Microgenomates bacterium]
MNKSIFNLQFSIFNQKEKGQALIVVILTLLVVSVVVLAAASRSITDVKLSQTSEESARAFSAAEAGVEEAAEKIRAGTIIIGADNNVTLPNNANTSYVVSKQGSSNLAFLSSTPLAGDTDDFQTYLANKDDFSGSYTGAICLLWGNSGTPSDSQTPAVSAVILYKNPSSVTRRQFVIDSAASARNNFTPANNDASCLKQVLALENNLTIDRTFAFAHKMDIPVVDGYSPVLLRIRLLFNKDTAHYVGIKPVSGALPSQGYKISSIGSSGQTARKVDVFQSYPSLPAVFDFALFNDSGTLSK